MTREIFTIHLSLIGYYSGVRETNLSIKRAFDLYPDQIEILFKQLQTEREKRSTQQLELFKK